MQFIFDYFTFTSDHLSAYIYVNLCLLTYMNTVRLDDLIGIHIDKFSSFSVIFKRFGAFQQIHGSISVEIYLYEFINVYLHSNHPRHVYV